MEPFQIVTEELLGKLKNQHYAGDRKLKEGDKIIFGFNILNTSSPGFLPQEIDDSDLSLHMNCFVLDNTMLFQLYKKK